MKNKVYKELPDNWKELLPSLVETLRTETIPFDGHPDPGAIHDCWNSVQELIDLVVNPTIHVQSKQIVFRAILYHDNNEIFLKQNQVNPNKGIEECKKELPDELQTAFENHIHYCARYEAIARNVFLLGGQLKQGDLLESETTIPRSIDRIKYETYSPWLIVWLFIR